MMQKCKVHPALISVMQREGITLLPFVMERKRGKEVYANFLLKEGTTTLKWLSPQRSFHRVFSRGRCHIKRRVTQGNLEAVIRLVFEKDLGRRREEEDLAVVHHRFHKGITILRISFCLRPTQI